MLAAELRSRDRGQAEFILQVLAQHIVGDVTQALGALQLREQKQANEDNRVRLSMSLSFFNGLTDRSTYPFQCIGFFYG